MNKNLTIILKALSYIITLILGGAGAQAML